MTQPEIYAWCACASLAVAISLLAIEHWRFCRCASDAIDELVAQVDSLKLDSLEHRKRIGYAEERIHKQELKTQLRGVYASETLEG